MKMSRKMQRMHELKVIHHSITTGKMPRLAPEDDGLKREPKEASEDPSGPR
jgi:hypothetical protein